MPFGAPVGLLSVCVATAVAWIAVLAGWSNILEPSAVSESLGQLALRLPIPGGEVLDGLRDIAPLLATAIPLGVYNFAEGMTNVESAAAAGDHYRVRQVLAADGLGAIVGSFLGSPFPPAVYIGHPGWKAVGGRIGYSLVTGIVVAIVCVTGLVGTFLAIFPMQALGPVLLYIGLVIGSQANTASAKRYAPAIVLALLPSLAQWATGQIDNALAAAGTTAATVVTDLLFVNGTLMRGLGLHGNLAGAELLEETRTAPAYRVHTIGDVHPGMYRADEGGASIAGELYAIPIETLLRVIEGEPPGLYRGPVELVDGRVVPGILFDEATAKSHPEITALGGWREYLGSRSDVAKS
jgi:gamma-glutamylcyclotransferase (GGCT)/AIG2-like uncharacterized protein YtfP